MPPSVLLKYGIDELWWYHAILKGSNGQDYIIRYEIDNPDVGRGSLVFTELAPEDQPIPKPTYTCVVPNEKLDLDSSQQLIHFHNSGPGCEIDTIISPARGAKVTAVLGQTRVELNFRSRGRPVPYDGLTGLFASEVSSGVEDFSDVGGTLTIKGTNVTLTGTGTQERVRYTRGLGDERGDPGHLMIRTNDWFMVNFDSVYLMLDRLKTNKGGTSVFAGAMMNQLFKSAQGKDITIEVDPSSVDWPKWIRVKMRSDQDSVQFYGTAKGKALSFVYGKGFIDTTIYDCSGTMVMGGVSVPLTGGSAWVELRHLDGGAF